MAPDRRRWTVGLVLSEDGCWVRGAAVAAYGSGFEARAQVMACARTRVPRESRKLYRKLARGRSRGGCAIASVLAGEVADVEASVVRKLVAREPLLEGAVLCLAVHDPGLWWGETGNDRAYLSLCDAARLAELTGANVLDALPARDLAQGGQGGPLLAAGQWMLIHHVDRPRVVIHIGHTTRVTCLPPSRDASGIGRIAACDAGPGTRLLDSVSAQISADRRPDIDGHLAVQGCVRPDMQEKWSADPAFAAASDLWHPAGVPQRQLAEQIVKTVNAGSISGPDALCTITHLIAGAIVERIAEQMSAEAPLLELVLTGRGRRNGLLRQQLSHMLPHAKLLSERDVGMASGVLEPAAVAMLAQLFLEQIPANQTAASAAQVPRVLGRLTPGSPQNWLRLLREMAKYQPVATLRSAM